MEEKIKYKVIELDRNTHCVDFVHFVYADSLESAQCQAEFEQVGFNTFLEIWLGTTCLARQIRGNWITNNISGRGYK